ncbi:MAG: GIY-YIG nuclease family protein [Ignavibacteria bacterium]|nr:GIY-YIG nuclease family protein [Ignavibacteria bacterium]
MEKRYYVYILASKKNGTLYTGVTNNLIRRVDEHKRNIVKGFTEKYNVHNLVYFEEWLDIREAITREKRIKKWRRQWKVELIEKENPEWLDLFPKLIA